MLSLNEHKNILVIYDSLEMFRQPHADNHTFMERIISNLFLESQSYSLEFAYGNYAEEVLNNLNESKYDLIIFSSNAIIRRDSNIYRTLDKNKDCFKEFIGCGKNLVVFHQGFAGVDSEVDFLEFAGANQWISTDTEGGNIDFSVNLEHPIMQFPNRINKDNFIDKINKTHFHLCYNGIELASDLPDSRISKVVWLESPTKCTALMTYENKGRLVLCPYPADWIKDDALTSNILYYAIYGLPKIVSITKNGQANEEYYNMLCTRISGIETVTKYYDCDDIEYDPRFNYLAQHAKLFIFPSDDLKNKYLDINIMKKAIENGSKLVVANPCRIDDIYVENLNILVGQTNYNQNNIVFNSILSDLKISNWFKNALLHDIHDVIVSVNDSSFNNSSYSSGSLNDIISSFKQQIYERAQLWVANNSIKQDPVTGIMAAWLIKISEQDKKIDDVILDKLKFLVGDKRCKDFSLTLQVLLSDGIEDVCIPAIDYGDQELANSLGTIVRRLDDINMCRILGAKIEISPEEYEKIYFQIFQRYKERPDFFDKSEATIPTVVSITRFLLDIPSNLDIKTESNVLLNDLVCFLSNYSSQSRDKNNKVDFNSLNITHSKLSLLMSIGILLKVDKVYPRGLFESLSSIEELDNVAYSLEEKLELLYKGITNRDKLIEDLKLEMEEFHTKTSKEISEMRARSSIGGITIIVSMVILLALNTYFIIRVILSKGNGFTEDLGILLTLLPVTIAYITFVIKSKLYVIK